MFSQGHVLISIFLPSSPRRSRHHLFHSHYHLRRIFSCGFGNKRNAQMLKVPVEHLDGWRLISGAEPVPWDGGELLFQSLDVSELDGLSPSASFNHITLEMENTCSVLITDL